MESSPDPVVAVVPVTSPAARAVALRLANSPTVSRVVGIDDASALSSHRSTLEAAGVGVLEADTTSPAVAEHLAGVDCVVLVSAADDVAAALTTSPATRRGITTRRAEAVLTASAATGARHVVSITSAMVFGANPERSAPIGDDTPRMDAIDSGLVGDLLAVEDVLDRAEAIYPGLVVTRMRPAALVGPGVDSVITRHFEAPRLLTVSGSDMAWQFLHVADLASACEVVMTARITGSVTVGSEGAMSQDDVESVSGMRSIELPAALALSTARRLHRVGVLPMPPEDLFYVVYPWPVTSARLVEAGWSPLFDNMTCLSVLLDEVSGHRAVAARRVERRDAALASAGAAVAVVSTAAAWRQARARQRRRA